MPTTLNYPNEIESLTYPDAIMIGKLNSFTDYDDIVRKACLSYIPNFDLIVTLYFKKEINGVNQCYPLFKNEFSDLKETEDLYCVKDIMIYVINKNKYIGNTEQIDYPDKSNL